MKIQKIWYVLFLVFLLLGLSSCKKSEEDITEQERQKMDEMFYSIFSQYDINNITENLNLIYEKDGYLISYQSNNPNIISDDGVINPGIDDQRATMDVTITSQTIDLSLTKTFVMKILSKKPIPIRELVNASGIYKIKAIVSAICRNVVYLEDGSGKGKITLPKKFLSMIAEGDEVLITFDDSQEENIVRFEVLSQFNTISKSVKLVNLSGTEQNYYRRADLAELIVDNIDIDPTNVESDIIVTLTDGVTKKDLVVANKIISSDEKTLFLLNDLEIGDIVRVQNIICDEELYYISDSVFERTKKVEITYSSIVDIKKEGIFYLRGRVEHVLLNAFIIKDEKGSKLIHNPNELFVEVGKFYSFRVESSFSDNIELTLKRVKELDFELDVDSNPIFFTSELLELLNEKPIDSYIYSELIGEIIEIDDEKVLVPFGTKGTYIYFNKGVGDSYVGENVKVVGFLTESLPNGFSMILDKIDLAQNVKISPISVEFALSKTNLELYESEKIDVLIYPYYANYNNEYEIKFSRNDVINIDKDGNIRAIGFGEVNIMVITSNNVIDQLTIKVDASDNNRLAYYLFGFDHIDIAVLEKINFKPLDENHTYSYSYDSNLIHLLNNKLSALDLGVTEIIARVDDKVDVKIKVVISGDKNSGYDIIPDIVNKEVVTVYSIDEFNDVLMNAYLNRNVSINIKFGYNPESNNPIDLVDPRLFEIALVSFNTYYIENGHAIMATFTALDGLRGTIETGYKPNELNNLINVNRLLDIYGIYQNKRSNDFDQFKLYEVGTNVVNVKTTQELFVSIEKGYVPNFILSNSRAEHLFNIAKQILRNIITDDMTDAMKVKTIYDYIVTNVELDKDASKSQDKNLKANDLEGAFSGLASEEGLAKMFVVLCGIEGIKAKLVRGTNQTNQKYWNYVEIDGINYLVSLSNAITLSLVDSQLGKFYNRSVAYINYEFFLKDSTILKRSFPTIKKFSEIDDTETYNFLKEEIIYDSNIDYEINSQEEFNYLFRLIKSFNFNKGYYVTFSSKNFMITNDKIKQALIDSGITDDFYLSDLSTENHKMYVLYFKKTDNN